MRKQHNHSSIDPRVVETMTADGYTVGEIAIALNVDRTTLYHRNARNPELREAVKRGNERRRNRIVANAVSSDAGDELEALLRELLRNVQELGERRAA
jgi:hypothetical protein